jgi:hypothetical protein
MRDAVDVAIGWHGLGARAQRFACGDHLLDFSARRLATEQEPASQQSERCSLWFDHHPLSPPALDILL